MSTLFDRELRRLQQTNYETRSSTEARGESGANEAVERVRELARRQQALNRQEQELARQRDDLTGEDLRRRLERLTREQIALREEAENLARQLGQQGQRQGGSTKGGQGGEKPQALREAADDMQGATSDLRRQEPVGAGAKGTRALEGLRRLEALMERDLPEATRKAFGEAQLEARQIAEAQRRLASEAAGLERTRELAPERNPELNAELNDEVRRQLAEQEERLARRVDDLEQALRGVAAQAGGEAAKRAGDAVRQLEREAVSRRMRETADGLRASQDRTGGRGTEKDAATREQASGVARALEALADRVGARMGDSAEVQELSDALRRTREVEERLGRLEQRIGAELGREEGGRSESGGQQARDQQGKGGASGAGELARLEDAYRKALQDLQALRERVERPGRPGQVPLAGGWTVSAPGTEGFKRDLSAWDALRRGVNATVGALETSLAGSLAEQLARERLSAGDDDSLPEEYRALAAKYYEAIAAEPRKP